MRILHTSDWHLGKIIFGKSLLEDQIYFIENSFFSALDEEKPDAVIIAGDIFDRQIAPADAIRLFDEVVSRICFDYKIPLIVATGNHDGADRFSLGAGLLSLGGFHLTTRLNPDTKPVSLEDKYGTVKIHSLPWLEPAMVRDVTGEETLRSYSDAYAAVTGRMRAKLDRSARHVLVSHCFVTGSQTSESESTLFVGGGGDVSSKVFKGFDYVALGHLHAPQKAGGNARYSGSPLKYSFDEEHQRKSLTLVDIEKEVKIREIPVKPLRDLHTLTGSIQELQLLAGQYANDYVFVKLEGPPVFEPMTRLRASFPYILGLSGNLHMGDGDTVRTKLRAQLKNQDDLFIFEQFFTQMCGEDATDEDRAVFKWAMDKGEEH